jgi:hypothetical protein
MSDIGKREPTAKGREIAQAASQAEIDAWLKDLDLLAAEIGQQVQDHKGADEIMREERRAL